MPMNPCCAKVVAAHRENCTAAPGSTCTLFCPECHAQILSVKTP